MTATIHPFPSPVPASTAAPPDLRSILTVFMGFPTAKADWVAARIGHRWVEIVGSGSRLVITTCSTWPAEVQRVVDAAAERDHRRVAAALRLAIDMASELYDAQHGAGGAA